MKTLLKLGQQKNSIVPILNRVTVINGQANATDMDIEINSPLPNFESGVYYPYLDDVIVKDEESKMDDYPSLGLGVAIGLVTYRRKDLLDALAFCSPAMSTDKIRYYLNGIYFDGQKMAATNGHILKVIDTGVNFPAKMILPLQAVSYLTALLKEKKTVETVDVQSHVKGFKFSVGDTVLKSRLVDGNFPDYTKVIPEHKKNTDFDLGQIAQYKKQIAALGKIAVHGKSPCISLSNGLLKWLVVGPAYVMEFPANLNLDIEIGFNYKYLLSMMSGKMSYGSAHDPVKIEEDNKLCAIMPTRF